MNRVILVGNLGADPVVRVIQENGNKVANFRMATDESYTDRNNRRVERTEWHNIVVFGNALIESTIERYLVKGKTVAVEGRLTNRRWTDRDNVERFTSEVVVDQIGGYLRMVGPRQNGDSDRRPPERAREDEERAAPRQERREEPRRQRDDDPQDDGWRSGRRPARASGNSGNRSQPEADDRGRTSESRGSEEEDAGYYDLPTDQRPW